MNILKRNVALLLFALLAVTGCGKGGCTSSSSFSTEFNLNGRTTSHKTITRVHDGVSRRLETTTDVDIQNGQVTKFPSGALIKLQEIGGAGPGEAELRETAGKLELWVWERGGFRRGSAKEELWLKGFLGDLSTK